MSYVRVVFNNGLTLSFIPVFLCVCRGSELRPSCLSSKDWIISPALSFLTLEPVVYMSRTAPWKSQLHCMSGHCLSSRSSHFQCKLFFILREVQWCKNQRAQVYLFDGYATHKRSVLIQFLHGCNQFSVLSGSASPTNDSPHVLCRAFSLQTVENGCKRTTFPPMSMFLC